jgi:hypothetical protein
MRDQLEGSELWLATPGAFRKIGSLAPHLVKTGLKGGPYGHASGDRFIGRPVVSRIHRPRRGRWHKASPLNRVLGAQSLKSDRTKGGIDMLRLGNTDQINKHARPPEEIRHRAYGNLVEAQLNERLALVQLYQALGAGWQQ